MVDMVNHPPHYNSSGITCDCGRQVECIDVTRHQSFNIGNVMKYIWRYGFKNGIEDLKKAAWYLNDEIKKMEHHEHEPRPAFEGEIKGLSKYDHLKAVEKDGKIEFECQHESNGIVKDNSGTFELGCYKCLKCGEFYR